MHPLSSHARVVLGIAGMPCALLYFARETRPVLQDASLPPLTSLYSCGIVQNSKWLPTSYSSKTDTRMPGTGHSPKVNLLNQKYYHLLQGFSAADAATLTAARPKMNGKCSDARFLV